MKKLLVALLFAAGVSALVNAAEIVPDYYFTAESLLDELEDGAEVKEWYDTRKQVKFILPEKTRRPVLPPILKERILNGNPALYFDEKIRTLYIPGFANEVMAGKSFTFIYGELSMTGFFGFSGNNPDGSVTAPKLEMQCGRFTYGKTDLKNLSSVNLYRVNAYVYNLETQKLSVYHNGKLISEAVSAPVAQFGGGGNLAVPFMPWPHSPRKGMIAEIMVFKKALAPAEIKQLSDEIRARNRN
ncbi:MAG: hypothetical protein IJW33_01065 [Lentisphaeria bacterium]|nr:hypothetical protein [Lentisphaeria bacterium]